MPLIVIFPDSLLQRSLLAINWGQMQLLMIGTNCRLFKIGPIVAWDELSLGTNCRFTLFFLLKSSPKEVNVAITVQWISELNKY